MYIVKFVTPRVFAKGHSNILEDSIFVTHTKVEYVALIRAAAIIDLPIAVPMRWIAGNGSKLKKLVAVLHVARALSDRGHL